jgi:signal transduction histidine kinase
LLDDLLLLAQAGTGWQLQLRPVAIQDVFMETYEAAQPGAEGMKLQIETCQSAWILGDPDRLRQVFTNLIDNALKYSQPEGLVKLELRQMGSRVQVRISDQGEGISSDAMERIFDPFFREPDKTRRPGSGLGLAITRWIVHQHNGEIIVESKKEQGTTVTLIFPAFES